MANTHSKITTHETVLVVKQVLLIFSFACRLLFVERVWFMFFAIVMVSARVVVHRKLKIAPREFLR
jgi:hypothetical protein